MADDRVRKRVLVHGRVQGVFFRGSTEEQAREHGVDGWVRNRPDAMVEAVFEGPAEAVDALVAYCHHGPAWARVTGVEVFDEPSEDLRGFRVR